MIAKALPSRGLARMSDYSNQHQLRSRLGLIAIWAEA